MNGDRRREQNREHGEFQKTKRIQVSKRYKCPGTNHQRCYRLFSLWSFFLHLGIYSVCNQVVTTSTLSSERINTSVSSGTLRSPI